MNIDSKSREETWMLNREIVKKTKVVPVYDQSSVLRVQKVKKGHLSYNKKGES